MHLRTTLLFLCILLSSGLAYSLPSSGADHAVSSAHPLATQAGIEILERGGNAADAAAAVAFVLAVVEPYSSGLGGGGFALTQFQSNIEFLDFRETAPAAAHRDMYLVDGEPRNDLSRDGILSVAVPGAILGYLQLHERFGVLPREIVLRKASLLAKEGFPVTPRYQKYATWRFNLLAADAYTASIFLSKGEQGGWKIPELGDTIRQPDLAKTLETLALDGADTFYKGPLGDTFITDIKRRGGILSREDLANYETRLREPLFGHFKGHLIASSPPPSSGGAIILTALGILEHVEPPTSPRDPEWLHNTIEAWKHAYADRALLGDADFIPIVQTLLPRLTAPKRAYRLAQALNANARKAHEVSAGEGIDTRGLTLNLKTSFQDNNSADTSHLSVVDRDGNAVAMTTTVNYGFGSGIVARGSGILLNDEMDDFAIAPGVPNAYGIVGSEANAVEPGKVPLSSMSPTFVFQGRTVKSGLKMVVGSPGGSRIPTTVMQAIWNHLLFGMNAQDAINFPRVHHQHLPDKVFIETHGLDPMTQDALKNRGHALEIGKNVEQCHHYYQGSQNRKVRLCC